MPAGDRLINTMKKVSQKANPGTKDTDLVYGVVQKASPLTVLIDNRLELTEEFLLLSPFCYKTAFSFSVNGHSHNVSISSIMQDAHSHYAGAISIKGHKHTVDDKDTSEAGAQNITGVETQTAGDFNITPTASCGNAGGHKVSITLWDSLNVGDKLVMLRVAEGQAYMILYRDKLDIKVSCQGQ